MQHVTEQRERPFETQSDSEGGSHLDCGTQGLVTLGKLRKRYQDEARKSWQAARSLVAVNARAFLSRLRLSLSLSLWSASLVATRCRQAISRVAAHFPARLSRALSLVLAPSLVTSKTHV